MHECFITQSEMIDAITFAKLQCTVIYCHLVTT